jgi:outer membrane lipoprotein-sorting protein
MYKKILAVCALLVVLVFVSGCDGVGLRGPGNAEELSSFEKIQRMLVELHSYRAIATIEYRANKGSNIYETVQHARITGEYRVEVTGPERVAGSVTCSDGQRIYQFSTRVNGRVSLLVRESQERSEIFLTSFIKNYLASQEVSISVSNMEEGQRTVLEAKIPGDHPYLSTQKLWVDNETLKPVQLIIYDPQGAERIIVTYHAVEYNIELDDSLFSV